jgi:hypothetical protein
MPITIKWWQEEFVEFHFSIRGFGFGFQIGGYNVMQSCFIILSWHIVKRHQIWRSETHSRMDGRYHYRCVKNGKTVEDLTFRSPIVNHA